MSGFITALIKQRRDAKKAGPDTSGRLKEIIGIIRKYDYDDGITPEMLQSKTNASDKETDLDVPVALELNDNMTGTLTVGENTQNVEWEVRYWESLKIERAGEYSRSNAPSSRCTSHSSLAASFATQRT